MKDTPIGVILSAGKGSRLDPFNTHFPKPMLPIVNRPIIEHQIDQMKAVGIREVLIVVGHLKHHIIDHIGDGSALGVKVRYVEQHRTLGIAHAVMQLERHIDRNFLLYLGDILYVPKNLHTMMDIAAAENAVVVLAAKQEEDREAIFKNFLVDADDRGRVKRVVEKPRYLVNDLKGCGIYHFAPDFFDAVRRTPRTALRDEYEITDSIQISIDLGQAVYVAAVVEWDLNITFPSDILVGNRFWRERLGLDNVIADTAEVHPGARLSGTVLGRGVKVTHPVRMENVVVLPDTVVASERDLVDAVLYGDYLVECEATEKGYRVKESR